MEVPDAVTPEWVTEQIEGIKDLEDDPEVSHSDSDTLWEIVLMGVSGQLPCDQPARCAELALTVLKLGHTRWYS